jgi:stage II sporulation protein B
MDKPNQRRTITIKIDGKERPMKNRQESVIERNREQTQSPISDQVNLEAAAAKEPAAEGEDFEWILPTDVEGTPNEQKVAKASEQKKEPPQKFPFMNGKGKKINPERKKWLTTIFLIVIGAIVIGTIFGMTMLNIFLPDESAVQSVVTPAEQKQENIPPASNGDNDVQLQPLTAYVVQAGIYSSTETAQVEQEKLRKEGLPVQAIDMSKMGMDGKYALFIGMSGTINGAKNLSQELSAGGMETFAKEINTGAKTIKGVAEEEMKLLELAPQLFQTISGNMGDLQSSTLSEENQAAFAELEKRLTAIDKEKLKNESVLQVYSTLVKASSQYRKFQDSPSRDTDIALQQRLLSFLALYQNE